MDEGAPGQKSKKEDTHILRQLAEAMERGERVRVTMEASTSSDPEEHGPFQEEGVIIEVGGGNEDGGETFTLDSTRFPIGAVVKVEKIDNDSEEVEEGAGG